MRARLWTWWDTGSLAAYELVVIVIVLFVPGGWQFPTYLVSVAALAFAAYRFLHRTARGARIRASLPSAAVSTPTWLMFGAAFAVAVPLALAVRVLGAGRLRRLDDDLGGRVDRVVPDRRPLAGSPRRRYCLTDWFRIRPRRAPMIRPPRISCRAAVTYERR